MPARPGFLPRLIVLDESHWSFQENSKGNRPKEYCSLRDPTTDELGDVEGWFWKGSDRKYPHEFWSELLACRLGAEMGIPWLTSVLKPPCAISPPSRGNRAWNREFRRCAKVS